MKHLIISFSCFVSLLANAATIPAPNSLETQKLQPPKAGPAYHASVPPPTHRDVAYGEHERHVLDFWKAPSETPTPVVIVIHGGGWNEGSKERIHRVIDASKLLKAGISVVAINYRWIRHAKEMNPPVKAPLHDAAQALQWVRSKAEEWNIDKTRIGATGESAGACSSLWLAYHDDLADPKSKDPIARESTRLQAVAVTSAQTTLDPKQMKEWTPNSNYGGHAFGIPNFGQFLAERDRLLSWITEYSPYAHVNKGDPPVCLFYDQPPNIGMNQNDPTHSANFGVKLQEHCADFDVECAVVYPGAPGVTHKNPTEYFVATFGLKTEKPKK